MTTFIIREALTRPLKRGRNHSDKLWSDADVAKMISLWNAGHTAEKISNAFPDRSRSAVLGKIDRLRSKGLGLKRRRPIAKLCEGGI